ncbi:hypothetical protein QBC47DRAFT_191832 [Echria macrotheca]|uniref:Heterokaryon incompatibility domain-containing protein n=1 Tax=Echria macrotheca TaxID=438768 RepID=A0AAJ0F6F4_9PEZI|nr:hypothetical protein QBC47DRAFT_191832 [Echria macrotheca]
MPFSLLIGTMRLIKRGQDGELSLIEFLGATPPYAILSHTWSREAADEVIFGDIEDGQWKDKPAAAKLMLCSEQASRDGLEYFWVDTCCIDKSSMDELQSSINSMFQWYHNAAQCYVYLSDVSTKDASWKAAFRTSKWFTRGWTLQELLAPSSVQFFSRERFRLGDKVSLEREIHEVTKIPISALQNVGSFKRFDVDERFRWAEIRQTTREEDWTYCLLGIFGIFMPLNYGEGKENSVRRLRREIGSTPKRQEWLRRLYRFSYQDRKDRNPPRVEGTCEWFTSHARFQHWKQDPTASLLWVSADPGCGKSVLSKYLVDQILPSTAQRTTCYFFFKDDFPEQRSSVNALCAILHQIFYHHPASFSISILDELEEKGDAVLNSFGDLWRIFFSAVAVQRREVICILDALDECEASERDRLIEVISSVRTRMTADAPALKFLLTSRPYVDIKRGFRRSECDLSTIHLQGDGDEEAAKISAEIDIVIRSRAAEVSRTLSLQQDEHDVLLEELTRVSNRTYLWVHLVFDEIQRGLLLTPGRIRSEVRSIPRTVFEAYERILAKSRNSELTRKLLHIVVAAVTPFTLREMALALSIGPGGQSVHGTSLPVWSPEEELRFRDEVRQLCGLFVVIVDSKVYLLHQTAREFLVPSTPDARLSPGSSSTPRPEWQHSLRLEDSHGILARICMLRISISDFDLVNSANLGNASKKSIRDFLDSYFRERPLLRYAVLRWADHFRQGRWHDDEVAVKDATSLCRFDSPKQAWFWMYRAEKIGRGKIDVIVPDGDIPTVLVASYFGLSSVIERLSKKELKQINVKDSEWKRSAVHWAALGRHVQVLQLLVRVSRVQKLLWTPICLGAKDVAGRTPLNLASEYGHNDAVQHLLKAGANPNEKDQDGWTPLHYASMNGHDAVVQRLLTAGAHANAKDVGDRTPLHLASGRGRVAVVQRLLKAGARANAKDENGQTPLHQASQCGHNAVVQHLLDRGSDAGAKDYFGHTPLHYGKYHDVVMQNLLSLRPTTRSSATVPGKQSEHPQMTTRSHPVV